MKARAYTVLDLDLTELHPNLRTDGTVILHLSDLGSLHLYHYGAPATAEQVAEQLHRLAEQLHRWNSEPLTQHLPSTKT